MDHRKLATDLLSRPSFEVVAWDDPLSVNGLPADSDEALITGRVHVFDSGECRSTGRWS